MPRLIIALFSLIPLGQPAFAFAESRVMIGRCSYDNLTSVDGKFRKGYVVANFYRTNGQLSSASRIVVAEGVSLVDGSILDQLDKVQIAGKSEFDQGALWPTYEVILDSESIALNFSGYWINNLASSLDSTHPEQSTFTYATNKLGKVIISPLIDGSFLQNSLGQPNGYPACVFWASPIGG